MTPVILSDFMSEDDFSEFEEFGIDVSDLSLDFTLELTEENEFTFSYDTESFKEAFSACISDNIESIVEYGLADAGLSSDDLTDEVVQTLGYENLDDFYSDMSDEITSEIDIYLEDMDDELEHYSVSGYYTVTGNEIYFDAADSNDFDEGTINSDGTISIDVETNGKNITLVFTPQ